MRSRVAALVFVLVLVVPSGALAASMGQYRYNAMQHDAQGTILEPDGAATSVLGPLLRNCGVELPPFAGRCGADAARTGQGQSLAPGCSGADGDGEPVRRLDGQCGLATIGVGAALPIGGGAAVGSGLVPAPLSEGGMGPGRWPGRYAGTVRFLDGRITYAAPQLPAPTMLLDVNAALRAAGAPAADNILPGEDLVWAWYGQWTDHNGNGVIDHFTPGTAGASLNEFAWLGSCTANGGLRNPLAVQQGVCIEDPNQNIVPLGEACPDPGSTQKCAGTTLDAWLFPGNHHANENAAGHLFDMPGMQLVTFAAQGSDCATACDDFDRDYAGDPLLGRQDEVARDFTFTDHTGDMGNNGDDDTERQWYGGVGYASKFYGDDGLLVTAVQVYGVNCFQSAALPWSADLAQPAGTAGACSFLDVDRETTASPALEGLLVGDPERPTGGLKAIARGAWLLVRDDADPSPVVRFGDSVANGSDVYLTAQGPLRGAVDDLLLDRGLSREPNAAAVVVGGQLRSEAYSGTLYRDCAALPVGDARNPTADDDLASREAQHRGWCNAGAAGEGQAYAAYRERPRGFTDLQPVRNVVYTTSITVFAPPCTFCVSSDIASLGATPEPTAEPPGIAPAEDHRRALGPGQYYFAGFLGTWHDQPHTFDESVFPQSARSAFVTYPPDGWVGSLERATGQWRYRGFLPATCPTERDPPLTLAMHEAAECNPYLDGNVQNPQDYAIETGGDWQGACNGAGLGTLHLAPRSGTMNTQILVWRNHRAGLGPLPALPVLEAYGPGPVEPLAMGLACDANSQQGRYESVDYLLWPLGNQHDEMVTWATASVTLPDQTADTVTDLDRYVPWKPALP